MTRARRARQEPEDSNRPPPAEVAGPAAAPEKRDLASAILDTAGVLILVLDRRGFITRFNRACEELTGYSFAETQGQPFWDLLLLPQDVQPVRVVFEQLLAGQFPNSNENYWVTRSGGRRLIAWQNTALLDDAGAVEYIIATGIDITERRRSADAIRSLARFPSENPNPVLRLDHMGVILYANEASAPLLRAWKRHVGGQAPDPLRDLVVEAYATQEPKAVDVPSGTSVYSFSIVPVAGAGYVNLYGNDITERVQAQERLAYQAYLLDNVHDAVVATDSRFCITAWNHAAEEMYGWTFEQVRGRRTAEVLRTEFAPRQRPEFERIVRRTGKYYAEVVQYHRDGRPIHVEARTIALRDGANKIAGYVSVNRDISERRRAAQERESLLQQVEEQRRQTEELARLLARERDILQTLMENTPAQLAYLDPDFNFVQVNSAYARGSGHSQEELIGRNHFDLFPNAENQAIFEQVRETRQPIEFRAKPFEYADQPERGVTYWDWTLTPIQDSAGQVQGLVFSLMDVTERERTGKELRHYADRIKTLYEIGQAILAAQSEEEIAEAALGQVRQILSCSRVNVTRLDAEKEEFVLLATSVSGSTRYGPGTRQPTSWFWYMEELEQGRPHTIPDLAALSTSLPLVQALSGEGVRSYTKVPLLVDGHLIATLNLGMGHPGMLSPEQIEVAHELAEQLAIGLHHIWLHEQVRLHAVELEQRVIERSAQLQASEVRFRTIFEQASLGFILVDARGHIMESNPAFERMLGYGKEELRGKTFAEITHPQDRGADEELFQQLVDGRHEYYQVEKRYVRQDGQVRWANRRFSLVRGLGLQAPYVLGIAEDITERRQAEAALAQTEKLAIAGKLAASLAHDLSNPLQAVIGCLGLAEEMRAAGEDAGYYMQIVRDELKRAARIVGQLRDVNRRTKLEERRPTDVSTLLEWALGLSKKKCEENQIRVERKFGPELPLLPLAPDRIQQAFLNLLLNAIEAMPEGGWLEVSVSRVAKTGGVRILFTDSGVGIPVDKMAHIFDPFYTTKPEGLGLGLYNTKSIIEEHGGRIEVTSQVNKGTTFAVWLPEGAAAGPPLGPKEE